MSNTTDQPTSGIDNGLARLKKQKAPDAARVAPPTSPAPTTTDEQNSTSADPTPVPPTAKVAPTADTETTPKAVAERTTTADVEPTPTGSKKRPSAKRAKTAKKGKTRGKSVRRVPISEADFAVFDAWRQDVGHSSNTAVQLAFANHHQALTRDPDGAEELLQQAGLDVPPRAAPFKAEKRVPVLMTPSQNALEVMSQRADELGLSLTEMVRQCIAAHVNNLQANSRT